MNFIWFKKKISRFYTKLIINNFKRLVFNSSYFLLEGFNRAYYENKKKRGLKKLKIKYPIIAPIRFNGVSFLIFLNSSGLLEDRLISKVGFEVCLLDLADYFIKEDTTINVISLDSHIKNYKKVSFIKIDVQGLEKNVLDGALEIIKRDNPVIIFEHSDLYFKVPSETRIHISDLFSLQSYEIYLIRSGENEFKYLFLEDIDFRNSSDNIDGDFIAIPRGLLDIEQINVQQKH